MPNWLQTTFKAEITLSHQDGVSPEQIIATLRALIDKPFLVSFKVEDKPKTKAAGSGPSPKTAKLISDEDWRGQMLSRYD